MLDHWTIVAGGAGFIGTHLCKSLLEQGSTVLCIDNLSTGSLKNIEPLMHHSNFKFIEHDIIFPIELENIKEIYNLACPASPRHYLTRSIQTFKTNVFGSFNLLEMAKKCSAKILQASTSEIYGEPYCHPQKETYFGNVNPIGPRACYNEGKRAAETLFYNYFNVYKNRVKIVRLFNVYGPMMQLNDGRAIPNFILQALCNQPLTIYGSGEQTRSFCYISDIIEGLYKTFHSDDEIVGPLNLGNPIENSIIELAEIIIEITGSSSPIIFKEKLQDDPSRRCPEITYAENTINWTPKITLKEGLLQTISYYESLLKKNSYKKTLPSADMVV